MEKRMSGARASRTSSTPAVGRTCGLRTGCTGRWLLAVEIEHVPEFGMGGCGLATGRSIPPRRVWCRLPNTGRPLDGAVPTWQYDAPVVVDVGLSYFGIEWAYASWLPWLPLMAKWPMRVSLITSPADMKHTIASQ